MGKLKSCIFAISLVFGTLSVQAQDHYEANVAIGVKGGTTLSKINFNPGVPQSMKPGILLGGAFRYVEEKHFGLIVELNMEQRGWKEKFEGYNFQYQRTFTYVQLPMLTHIYFGGAKYNVFFNAGPEVGYMIATATKSNFDYTNIAGIEGFPSTNRNTDQFNLPVKHKFDYGISAGVGVEWYMNNKHSFLLEGRFYYGLNDVFSSHKTDTFSGSNSMSVMVSLGYFYRLK